MKYFIFLFLLVVSSLSFAACPPDVHGVFNSTLSDPPYTICANHSDFGSDKCVMDIYNMEQRSTGYTLYGKTNGSTCNQVTNLNPNPTQYNCTTDACPADDDTVCPEGYNKGYYNGNLSCVKEEEDPRGTLQCSSDYCFNPDNLRCPSNYNSGSMNGVAICAKNESEEEEEENVPCQNETDNDDCAIVTSVNNASNNITNAIDNQTNSIWDAVNQFWENLSNYLDEKLANGGNGGNGGGVDGGNGGGVDGDLGDVDTTPLEGELPYYEIDSPDQKLTQNIFSQSAQCPANNELNLNFMGKVYSYTFDYAQICDGARLLGYLILTAAYLFAALIVIRV